MKKTISSEQIRKMPYVEFMALLGEVNRPPGGKESTRILMKNSFISRESRVLDVGCNTGYCSFEIARTMRCQVDGIDLSEDMIEAAKMELDNDLPIIKSKINFQVANAEKLPFSNNAFDLTFSGGSTAFMDNKLKAIKEYSRVTKQWGFVGDINFYYHETPSDNLIQKLNKLMGTDIKPWGEEYWLNLYKETDLEPYHVTRNKAALVSDQRVDSYCEELAEEKEWPNDVKVEIIKKLKDIMTLFNENNNLLSYGVFIYRKREIKEQTTLFGV